MQRNNTPILLATIALGLLAILGAAFFFLGNRGAAPQQPTAAVPTPTPARIESWVAARLIPPRTVIDQTMLRRSSSTTPPPPDAITSLNDIKGMITSGPIAEGEMVTKSSFTKRIARVIPASFDIPADFRAVAIYVDPDSTAAGLVDVGDHVDVISTHRLHQVKDQGFTVVGATDFTAGRMLGQNLVVLAVDKSINAKPTPTPAPAGAPGASVAGGPPPAPTPPPPAPPPGQIVKTRVVLAALPDVATALIAAQDQGVLNIIIRNPNDADVTPVDEQREYPSFQVRLAPTSAPRPAAPSTVGTSPVFPTPIPMRTVEPAMTFMPASAPTPDPMAGMREVTVIRETEKTRVLVPNR